MIVGESTARRYALSDPDVRLMLEVRDDDASAFEELMLRYQNRVIAVLEHMVGDRDQAEDLAQEVFMRVYRARKNYQPGAKFATWLFTIVNNVALNALRTRGRRREYNVDATSQSGMMMANPLEGMAVAGSTQMPARRVDKAEMREVVRTAVETLGERQRMAVLLSKFEGMSYQEIAESMEMTTQAIKSLLNRARGKLRTALEPYIASGVLPAADASGNTSASDEEL